MTERLTRIRRLQDSASSREAGLKREVAALETDLLEQRRTLADLAAAMAPEPLPTRTVAAELHARRHGEALQAQYEDVSATLRAQEHRLAGLRAEHLAAAQEARVLQRLAGRLEAVQTRQRRREDQQLVDEHNQWHTAGSAH